MGESNPQMAALPPFQQLLERTRGDVLAYLIAMVGPDEAEDCFQETFLAALRAYPQLSEASNLRGWLFTIAHRKALDSLRRTKRLPNPAGRPAELAEIAEQISGAALAMNGDGRATTAGTVAGGGASDDSGEIWQTVATLPPKQRAAITLRFGADLSHRDIAAALDCSEAAARRSLHEGLNKLREAWT
jgi:RNA polymerase sigma factor (sigma-70 family)